jgi:general secretion pathway protein E
VGCSECAGTGYWGRVCIIEMMTMTDELRSLIMRHATSGDIRVEAIREGMETMFENGMRKSLAGITTIEEVLRVTRED